jgi:hypothetical protein
VGASEAFSARGVVEGEAVDFVFFVGLIAFLVVGGQGLEAGGFADDQVSQPVVGGLFFGWVEGLHAAGGELAFDAEFLAGLEFSPEFGEGVGRGRVEDLAGEEDRGDFGVVEGVQGLMSQ